MHVMWPHLQTFLATEDIGDSLEAVEVLITKHENYEKSLAAQEEKFKALDEMATGMIKSGNYAAEEVHARKEEVRLLVPLAFSLCVIWDMPTPDFVLHCRSVWVMIS